MDTMNIFAARHKISTGRKFLKKFSSEKSLTGSSVDNPVVENGIVVSRSFYKKGYFRNQTWFSCGIPARINKKHNIVMLVFDLTKTPLFFQKSFCALLYSNA